MKKLFFVTLFLFVGILVSQDVNAHVPEGEGEPLQLYSGWCTSPPMINGNVTDGDNPAGSAASGTTPDEWEDGFCRRIHLIRTDNAPDPNPCYLYLMNNAAYLYVGVVYYCVNNGAPNRVTLYFDQGVSGGSHDDVLTLNNENAVSTNRGFNIPWDRYWDGANWVDDAAIDFDAWDEYYTDRFQWEFRIPLTLGGEDLNVNGGNGITKGDELGFLLEIFKNGDGTYHYNATNRNPNDAGAAPGWM